MLPQAMQPIKSVEVKDQKNVGSITESKAASSEQKEEKNRKTNEDKAAARLRDAELLPPPLRRPPRLLRALQPIPPIIYDQDADPLHMDVPDFKVETYAESLRKWVNDFFSCHIFSVTLRNRFLLDICFANVDDARVEVIAKVLLAQGDSINVDSISMSPDLGYQGAEELGMLGVELSRFGSRLLVINLNQNKNLSDRGLGVFARYFYYTNCISLKLSGCSITAAGIRDSAKFLIKPRLQDIDFSDNPMGDLSIEPIARYAQGSYSIFDFANCSLTAVSMPIMAGIARHVICLSLCENPIGNTGVKNLALGLKNADAKLECRLRTLNLRRCNIDDGSIEDILLLMPFCKNLIINDNSFSSAIRRRIFDAAKLQHVEVDIAEEKATFSLSTNLPSLSLSTAMLTSAASASASASAFSSSATLFSSVLVSTDIDSAAKKNSELKVASGSAAENSGSAAPAMLALSSAATS